MRDTYKSDRDSHVADEVPGEDQENITDYSHLPIDHGWAFATVFGCFGVCALVVGTLKSFGVILVELSRRFNVPASVLIGPQCLAGFFHLSMGPVANALSERFTHRLVVFVGGVLAAIGLVCTSFIQSVPALYVTYGVMCGIGLGLCLSPSLTFQGFHFRKRRALASGLSVSGSGAGSFALPPIIRYLINYYGLGGCLLLLGAFMLHTCIFCSLYRPPSYWRLFNTSKGRKHRNVEEERIGNIDNDKACPLLNNAEDTHTSVKDEKSNGMVTRDSGSIEYCLENEQNSLYKQVYMHSKNVRNKFLIDLKRNDEDQHRSTTSLPCTGNTLVDGDMRSRSVSLTQSNKHFTSNKKDLLFSSLESFPSLHVHDVLQTHTPVSMDSGNTRIKSVLEWSLLKTPSYIIFVIVLFTGVMGQHTLYNILPSVANERGVSDEQGAIVVSILGITDLIGRILFGWLADFGFVKRQTVYHINLTLFALIGFIVPHVGSFVGLCLVVVLLGIFTGGYTGCQLAVLSDKFGPEKLSSSWGFAAIFVSFALLINPVLAGVIHDITGSWIGAVTLGACVSAFGSCLFLTETLIIRIRHR
ncbi:monocarboxylate transporter 12-like [Argopecten irradians]|uniref:monocarboxylate transporter 12-like n=1 Tax=Argopecten irradians TaxID=31199 RepID=UPI00370FB795